MRRRENLWIQNHSSGARVVLADGGESREFAAAVAGMVATLPMRGTVTRIEEPAAHMRATVSRISNAGARSCTDCLECELAAMRTRRARNGARS